MTRDEVLQKMRQAGTLEQIRDAQQAVNTWMEEHPRDTAIAREAEGLWMLESALRLTGVESTAEARKKEQP